MKIFAVCGIDTGIGKSVVTGLLANHLLSRGRKVMTQKLVQTGCTGRPADILTHRQLMGSPWNELDEQGLSCPYCLPFPASPQLAARLAGVWIDPGQLEQATLQLAQQCDVLLVEGVGGLLVPLSEDLTVLDYLAARDYPIILVTSPRLGSINHTLLSLEVLQARGMRLAGLVYNQFGEEQGEIIEDSLRVFAKYLQKYGFAKRIVVTGALSPAAGSDNWDLLELF